MRRGDSNFFERSRYCGSGKEREKKREGIGLSDDSPGEKGVSTTDFSSVLQYKARKLRLCRRVALQKLPNLPFDFGTIRK